MLALTHPTFSPDPAERLRVGRLAVQRGRFGKAREFLAATCPGSGSGSGAGATLLRNLGCSPRDDGRWLDALAIVECVERAAELAQGAHPARGSEATRLRVHARLVQVETLVGLGELAAASRLLDEVYILARGVLDPVMEAALWWTAANVARSHGRWSTAALALQRVRTTGTVAAEDASELVLCHAEACMEAGWFGQGMAALRDLDGLPLSKTDVGRLLGLRGFLALKRDVAGAWGSFARAERRLEKRQAWHHLGLLRLRMARAACKTGHTDPLPILRLLLDPRVARALPGLERRVAEAASRTAARRGFFDLALLAEMAVEEDGADVRASRHRQVRLLADMGFRKEATALAAWERRVRAVERGMSGGHPTPVASEPLDGRNVVARGCRMRRRLQTADLRTVDGLHRWLDRAQHATRGPGWAPRRQESSTEEGPAAR